MRKTRDHVRTLTLVTPAGTETIETTDEHPFWLDGAGWVGASQLTVGQRVVLIDGSDAMVASTERAEHPDGIAVFNLEVEADHTYFVADADTSFTNPVWVHNRCHGAEESIQFAVKSPSAARSNLRSELGLSEGDGFEAHHLIPIGALDQSDVGTILVKAARGGFHFNGASNGRRLFAQHGSHPTYTADVIREIRRRQAVGLITDDASAAAEMADVAGMFRQKIDKLEYWQNVP